MRNKESITVSNLDSDRKLVLWSPYTAAASLAYQRDVNVRLC